MLMNVVDKRYPDVPEHYREGGSSGRDRKDGRSLHKKCDTTSPVHESCIINMVNLIIGDKPPRAGQIQALSKLADEGKDAVLAVHPGCRKSVILSAYTIVKSKISILPSPV